MMKSIRYQIDFNKDYPSILILHPNKFIKDIIILTSNSISSANIQFDVNILIMYATYFYDIKNQLVVKNLAGKKAGSE